MTRRQWFRSAEKAAPGTLNYDSVQAPIILNALMKCSEEQRFDTLALAMKVFIEGDLPLGAPPWSQRKK